MSRLQIALLLGAAIAVGLAVGIKRGQASALCQYSEYVYGYDLFYTCVEGYIDCNPFMECQMDWCSDPPCGAGWGNSCVNPKYCGVWDRCTGPICEAAAGNASPNSGGSVKSSMKEP